MRAALMSACIVLTLAACGNRGGYPDGFADNYVRQCTTVAGIFTGPNAGKQMDTRVKRACECALDKIQGEYTYREYVQNPAAAERFAGGQCLSSLQ